MQTIRTTDHAPSRRDVFRAGTVAGAATFFTSTAWAAASLPKRGPGPGIYERLSVQPFINCTSDRTINGGAVVLQEVVDAVHDSSYYHANLEELMAAVGPRIAELLDAPGAMVSSGCAGALTCATLACMAGGDIETLQQVPNTDGIKDEVVTPRWSRSIYDHAVRMTGAKMMNIETAADLDGAFGPQTFMVFAGKEVHYADSKIPLEALAKAAHQHGVPVLVDAASELPLKPDPYLSAGADLVAYSGGKALKGPQTAGLLLGRKDLIDAAFIASAPHHTFARPMKVAKEEIIGILAAVEALVTTRDVEAEWEQFRGWYRHIKERITEVPGVKAWIVESPRPSFYPVLRIEWDTNKIGVVAREIGEELLNGEPRIMCHAFPKELDPTSMETNTFDVRPMALYPGDYRVVAERLHEAFKKAPKGPLPQPKYKPPVNDLSGQWEIDIEFVAGKSRHTMYLELSGNELQGLHRGRITQGRIHGHADGDRVTFESRGKFEAADMRYFFTGLVRGDEISGELGLGEYGKARWTARRQAS